MMIAEKESCVYDGPCVLPKSMEDVIFPSRCENPQPPSPSNPNGAHHVTLADYPNLDEIKRLRQNKYYDLLTDEDMEAIEAARRGYKGAQASDPEQQKVQRDALGGMQYGNAESAENQFERLTWFGPFDIDGDGLEEECVLTLITNGGHEHGWIARARYLTEMFPCLPPRRPMMHEQMIPVQGQPYGIGLPELLEHLHDLIKVTLDQSVDKNTLVNTPWGFYRSASGVRPETIRMGPGELYPVSNPANDVVFPSLPNPDQSFSINLMTLLNQWSERQAVIGEMQFGRVPTGKASALRNQGSMNMILQQGDARPERLLRRFFNGLSQIYAQMHELNQVFLQPGKKYKVLTGKPSQDPYRTLDDVGKIQGRFQFEFKANVLNSNKAIKSQVLTQLASTYVNGMTIQMGLVSPSTVYNLLSDFGKANGQDPTRYLVEPAEGLAGPTISAEAAVAQISEGLMPDGWPAEGPMKHLEAIQEMQQNGDYRIAMLTEGSKALFDAYLKRISQLAQREQAMMQMAQQAQQFAQGQGGAPNQAGGGDNAQQPVGQNELMDETMPSGGGGAAANGGMMQ
jgi:hypothetical protein